jgi:hypothetical protein
VIGEERPAGVERSRGDVPHPLFYKRPFHREAGIDQGGIAFSGRLLITGCRGAAHDGGLGVSPYSFGDSTKQKGSTGHSLSGGMGVSPITLLYKKPPFHAKRGEGVGGEGSWRSTQAKRLSGHSLSQVQSERLVCRPQTLPAQKRICYNGTDRQCSQLGEM